MARTREYIEDSVQYIEEGIAETENYDWIKVTGKFVNNSTLEVNGQDYEAQNFVLANGARPIIPDVRGLNETDYITNRNVFELSELPKSMIIIGGGYLAVEFAHFFSAMGTVVTILGRNPYIVKNEDKDVSELLKKELSKRMNVVTNIEPYKIEQKGSTITVQARNRDAQIDQRYETDSLFITTGRRPNSDILLVEKARIDTDRYGFVKVNEYLMTSQEGIWALGDINGKYMYRHIANDEARIVYNNIKRLERKDTLLSMDYSAIPYAIFSQPQIATIDITLKMRAHVEYIPKRDIEGKTGEFAAGIIGKLLKS